MRKLIIGLGVLGVIIALLSATFVVFANRFIASHREEILKTAANTLGRQVTVDSLSVSLWGGIGIRLREVHIADDPRFSDAPFLQAEAASLHVRLWPLLDRRFVLASIDLDRPQVHLIRDTAGKWNYETLKPACSGAACTASVSPAIVRVAVSTPPTTSPVSALVVNRASIEDGTVLLDDRSEQPPRSVRAAHIDLRLRNIGVREPIALELDMALGRDAHNIHLHGTVGPLEGMPAIPISIDGTLGPLGPRDVSIDEVHVRAAATQADVRASELNGRAFDGSFALTGQYSFRGGEVVLKGELKRINLARLLDVSGREAPQIDGAADVAINLHGPTASADLLSGRIVTDIHDGVIKDFNLVNEVLGHVSGLPNIGTLISANVKPKYGRLFTDTQTRFDTLHGTFDLGDRRLATNDLVVTATDYGVRASGWVDFTRNADIAGTLVMSKRFSTDVAADVKEVKYVLDDNGQLAVPFRLRGKLGHAKPKPDSDYLINMAARALGRGAAKDLLEKFLGGKDAKQKDGASQDSLEKSLRNLFGH
jgi:uncharacterized protein YhdP